MNRGKFEKPDEKYFNYIDKLENMNPPMKELIYNFPVFVGEVNIARTLFFYELYKKVLNLKSLKFKLIQLNNKLPRGTIHSSIYNTFPNDRIVLISWQCEQKHR